MLKSQIMVGFLKESINEIKKVSWPDKKTSVRLTKYVIGVSFVVGIYVFMLDSILNFAVEKILIK